jgi:hypothetical protein
MGSPEILEGALATGMVRRRQSRRGIGLAAVLADG